MNEYQKNYKQQYNMENRIVTFPLKKEFYNELLRKSVFYDLSVNTYCKTIVLNSLNNDTTMPLTSAEQEHISKYIHISRGIANNINQIAHKTNINGTIDVDILIKSLKHYEDEFKKFISKNNDN